MWRSGKYPQVLPVRMSYYGITVILSEVNYPVFAPEWPEKLNFEFCIASVFYYKGLTLDIGFLAGDAVLVASVFHNHIIFVR